MAGAVDSTSDITLPESGFDAQTGEYVDDYIKVDSRSHAGGSLAFGPDGALYVSIGDGTSFDTTDPRTVSVQNINSLSGKILRIDPINRTGATRTTRSSSRATTSAPTSSKVYQLGLRNPFSIGFAQDGRLFIIEYGLVQLGGDRKWPCRSQLRLAVFRRRRRWCSATRHRDTRTFPATPRVTLLARPHFTQRLTAAP